MSSAASFEKISSLQTEGAKSEYFSGLAELVTAKAQQLGLLNLEQVAEILEKLWLPLALDLAIAQQQLGRTLIQGILGGQGTGKTTLCKMLQLILNYLDLAVASLSIDDLYLTYAERQALQQQDPRLIWRGPPGTHDVGLGLEVIEQCLQSQNSSKISLPRFDKSAFNGAGDRTTPELITQPDILLFEGWFVGAQPQATACFDNCPEPIVTPEALQFAQDNNQRLQAYLPLWQKLDKLIVLNPEDYRLSKQWRKEAEHKMIASGKTGMSDGEIERFVEYFWQALHPELFIKPLLQTADLVVEIKGDRSLGRIYRNC